MGRTINVVDLFCGGGGTTTGVFLAAERLGLKINMLGINHWDLAIDTFKHNHPGARYLQEELDNVNPRKVIPGGHLDLLVASPECIYHSRARGGKPVSDQGRASAMVILRWAEALDIDYILIENVPEFREWGPLDPEGHPIKKKKGKAFLAFLRMLRALGYKVDHRLIVCANYGDPTTRKRLFIQASKKGQIKWPEPTHSPKGDSDMFRNTEKWRTAREIIDFSIQGESIFTRKIPLVDNTLKRIEAGLRKYSGLPFVLGQQSGATPRSVDDPLPTVAGQGAISLVQPFLLTYHGASYDGGERVRSVDDPMPTVATSHTPALIQPFLIMLNGTNKNQLSASVKSLDDPLPTVTGTGHAALIEPFLVKYYGTGGPRSIDEPLDTITAKDRFGLVIPMDDGGNAILDIFFRMLQPSELAKAMSFPEGYHFFGKVKDVKRQIGNAVPVQTAAALCQQILM